MGGGNAYTLRVNGFVGDAYTPATETTDIVFLNMAAPVRTISDMRDNPKTLNRSGVYIYKNNLSERKEVNLIRCSEENTKATPKIPSVLL